MMLMTTAEVKEVLRLHALWLKTREGGARADLRGANLRDANLRGANLRDANLRGANLGDADLGFEDLIAVPGLHIKTLRSLEQGGALEMGSWHHEDAACATAHCRAGWYIHHAGSAGMLLERLYGPAVAGALIVVASCPFLEKVPNFYCANEEALADIQRCAAIEKEQGLGEAGS